uniref:Uncharacterized protein n=1 Tax=Bracon brevicornis TaxID=1563983 RepID=A0A6V7JQW6_9HYME
MDAVSRSAMSLSLEVDVSDLSKQGIKKSTMSSQARNNKETPTFQDLFNICRIALCASGIIGIEGVLNRSKAKISDLHGIYYVIGIMPTIVILLSQIRSTVYFLGTNIDVAVEICMVTLSSVVVIFQGFSIYRSRRQLLELISDVRDLWDGLLVVGIEPEIEKRVKTAQYLTKIYATILAVLGGSYTLKPFGYD